MAKPTLSTPIATERGVGKTSLSRRLTTKRGNGKGFKVMKQRGGLGRGLGALIPLGGPSITEVDIDDISPNPRQPRQVLDTAALAQLADSVREHGILQPLLVARAGIEEGDTAGRTYQLIAGERRWQAAKLAGLSRVPVMIKDATPQQMLELALVENIQRADLNPLEEAEAYRHLVDDFGLSQEAVAIRVGKSPSTVSNSLRLLDLAEEVKAALATGELSETHARTLLGLSSAEAQVAGMAEVLKKGLSVRQTEEYVRRANRARESTPRQGTKTIEAEAIEEDLRQALGTKVELFRGKKGGRLVIHFYSDDQLQGLYDQIVH